MTVYTYSALSDYNRLNYGKDIHLSLLSWNVQLSIRTLRPRPPALFCMGPDTPPSLIGLEGTPVCIPSPDWWGIQPYFTQGKTERWNGKPGGLALRPLASVCPLPRLGSVLSCLFNKSSVCSCCYWAVTSLLFKILAARPEPRNPACLSCN